MKTPAKMKPSNPMIQLRAMPSMVGARIKLKRATTTHSSEVIRLVSMVSLVRATLLKNMAVAYNVIHWIISNSETITYND
jgi:hypothetical protein